MSIRLLESHVVDQIAAGEVVERPASVVRELVENALDAGATAVDVVLRDGGRGLVRVTDDGEGMDRDDALMCIERHATSKIRTFEDLAQATTLGFRGEALPSIAAVSRFQLVTRRREDDEGTKIRIEAGTLRDVRPVGAAPGTVVEAAALFHALPARRAFLRSAGTELSHCVETLTRLALGRDGVAFTLRHDERELLRTERGSRGAVRAAEVLGDDARKLVPVAVSDGGLALAGLAAPPGVHRGSAAAAMYLYVNGRWVRDLVLRRAVAQAYRDRVPPGRHPLVVLDLRVPPGSVDVNVHPTKAEVRFRDPAGLAGFVEEALRGVLPAAPRAHVLPAGPAPTLPFRPSPLPDDLPPPPPRLAAEPAPAPLPPPRPPTPLPSPPPTGAPRWIGTAHQRFWVLEDEGGIVVVDAGRLARRVRVVTDSGEPRRLLVPARIPVPAVVAARAEERSEALAELGLIVARFSPGELVVRAVPDAVSDVDPAEVLRVALGADDVRAGWAERLPPAEVPDDLVDRARAAGVAVGPEVGRMRLL